MPNTLFYTKYKLNKILFQNITWNIKNSLHSAIFKYLTITKSIIISYSIRKLFLQPSKKPKRKIVIPEVIPDLRILNTRCSAKISRGYISENVYRSYSFRNKIFIL